MYCSVLADDEACVAVRILLECNCLFGDYTAWLNLAKLKREVAIILKVAAIKAARACNEALALAKQELARDGSGLRVGVAHEPSGGDRGRSTRPPLSRCAIARRCLYARGVCYCLSCAPTSMVTYQRE